MVQADSRHFPLRGSENGFQSNLSEIYFTCLFVESNAKG